MKNIYGIEGLFGAEQQEDEQALLNQSIMYNSDVQPETRAKSLQMQGVIRQNQGQTLPVETIEQEQSVYEKTLKDLSRMTMDLSAAPVTRGKLTDIYEGPLYFEDIENMKETESWYKDFADRWKIGSMNVELGDLNIKIRRGKGTIQDVLRIQQIDREQQALTAAQFTDNIIAEIPFTIVEQLPLMLEMRLRGLKFGLVGAAAGSEVPVVGTGAGFLTGLTAGSIFEMYKLEGGLAYHEFSKMRDANGRPLPEWMVRGASGLVGLVNGGIEFGGEKIMAGAFNKAFKGRITNSVRGMLNKPSTRKLLFKLGGMLGKGMAVNGGEEALQETTNVLMGELLEYSAGVEGVNWEERIQSIVEAGITGAQGGGLAIVDAAPVIYMQQRRDKALSKNQQMAEFLAGLSESSQIRKMMPEKQREFVKDVIKETGASDHVGVDVETLDTFFQETGISEQQVEATWPEVSQSMRQARETGAEVQIPMDTFMQDFVRSVEFQRVMPNVRMHPQLNTDAENAILLEQIGGIVADSQQVDTPVFNHFRNQLLQTQDPEVADRHAKLLASFFTTMAEREGTTTEDLLQRYQVDIGQVDLNEAEAAEIIAEVQAGESPTTAEGQSLQEFVEERGDTEETRAAAVAEGYFPTTDPEQITAEEIDQALASETPVYAYGKEDPVVATRMANTQQILREAEAAGVDITKGNPQELAAEIMSRRLDQSAFHGSPHRFKRFDIGKIGTGEGAQVYGWGLYFTSVKGIAEHYRKTLSDDEATMTIDGREISEFVEPFTELNYALMDLAEKHWRGGVTQEDIDKQVYKLGKALGTSNGELAKTDDPDLQQTIRRIIKEQEEAYDFLNGLTPDQIGTTEAGQLYKVEIPDDENLLSFKDSILSQDFNVMEKLEDMPFFDYVYKDAEIRQLMTAGSGHPTGRTFYWTLVNLIEMEDTTVMPYVRALAGSGEGITLGASAEQIASEVLNHYGIKGIKFPADRGQRKGESNFVIFDDKLIDIQETYYQTATVRAGDETLEKYGLDPSRRYKVRQVAAALEARQRDLYGSIDKKDRSAESAEKAAEWMAEEVMFEMRNPEDSGVGWYSEKYQNALDIMGEAFEELKTNKGARDTMTALIALTSDGQKVVPNFTQAMEIYGNFRATGKFTTERGHTRQASININLQNIQRLYDTMGPEGMAEYLTQEATIKELKQIAKENGGDLNVPYQGHIKMPMAAVELGPKLGAFYANLMGAHGYLTMDLWWSRTFNRYRGHLITSPTKVGLERFRTLIDKPNLSDDETIAATVEYAESYADKGYKNGTAIEKAANTIYKKAFIQVEDTPFNTTDRTFMIEAVHMAQEKLKEQGVDMTIADIQAALWYYEKRLYGDLGARQSADISYEEAAQRVAAGYVDREGGQPVQGEQDGPMVSGLPDGPEKEVRTGEEYYQRYDDDARGFINISPNRDYFRITLTGKANLSTFLHESGHMFLEIMDQLSMDKEASHDTISDMETIRDWLGWEEGQQRFTRDQHEKFARGFEAYLMEGKAPSIELQSAFRRFASWLTHIYKSIAAIGTSVTPEVAEVMDRMLASSEAIKTMQQTKELFPAFVSAEQAGMTDAEYTQYLTDFSLAMEDAEETMRTRLMREIAVRQRREYREAKAEFTEQVTTEVMTRPVYSAIDFLQTGMMQDTNDIPANFDKLDRAAVRRMFPNEPHIVKYLPRNITKDKGANPSEIATYFGFDSAHLMLTEMLNVKTAKQAIKEEVQAKLDATFGDSLGDPEAIQEEAASALHGDKLQDFMVKELRLFSSKLRRPVPPGFTGQAQLYADEMVSQMTINQLRSPYRFMQAEQREGRKAMQAAAQNDWEAAAEAKKNQIINHWLYRKAIKGRDESNKIHRYLLKFQDSKKLAKLGQAGGNYLESALIILEGMELKNVSQRSLQRRKSLAQYLESIENEGQIVQIPEHLQDETRLTNFSEMTLEDFRGMNDALKNIDRLATLKNKLIKGRKLIDFNSLMNGIERTIRDNNKALKTSGMQNKSTWDGIKSKMRSFDSDLLKVEFLFEQLDGGTVGIIHESVFQPMADAQLQYYDIMKGLDKTLFSALRQMPKDQRERMAQKYNFLGTSMYGHEVMAIALNMGNAGNMDKLIRGYAERGWSQESIMTALDSIMTKQDWETTQFIWDQVDQFWPAIVELNKKNTGLEPPKVEAQAVNSQHGTFRGGYYPVIYDPSRQNKSFVDAQKKASDMFENNFMRPNVQKGFTEARTTYAAPILLSLSGLGSHLNEVVHYLTHYEAVQQAYKIMKDDRFAQSMIDTVGQEYYNQLVPWLQNIANSASIKGESTVYEKFWNHMAVGTSIMAMGGSLSTGMMQLLGTTSAMSRLNPRWWASGMKQAAIPAARKFAYENSKEIPHLMKTFDRDGRKQMDDLLLSMAGGNKEQAKYYHGKIVQFSFYLIGAMQQQVNIATFMGAYQKGLDSLGMDEKRAINYADSVLRKTQSSGAKKDLAKVQRQDGFHRLITSFYTYFSSLYGLLRATGKEAFSGNIVQSSGQFAALVLLPTMIEQMMRPDPEGEELEDWMLRYVGNIASYTFATVPVLRDVVNGFLGYGYKMSPVGDIMKKGAASGFKAMDPDKDLSMYDFKNMIRLAGATFHLPVTQPLRWAEYFNAYLNGDIDEPFKEFIFGVRK